MKKTNLKKFVQKMLILGFCVPITLVCSSIPAMAEAATDTTVTNSGQQVSEQSTTTEASTENNDVNTVYTADKFLGQAVNYGIVANRFELKQGDAETNVAAKTGVCVNQTGNDLASEKDKQEFMLGTVENEFKIKGNKNVTLYTQSDQQKKVVNLDGTEIQFKDFSSNDINTAIDTLMQDIRTQSDTCLQKATDEGSLKATVKYGSDQKYHLVLPSDKPGTYFVTLDETIFSSVPDSQNTRDKFKQAEELWITAGEGQSIVFNVNNNFLDENNSFQLQKFKWNGTGSDAKKYLGDKNDKAFEPDDSLATSVIWNLPNVNTLNINGSVAGVIYAPNAIVNVNATSSGWIVANQVNITSGEWHNISHYQFKPTSPESIIPQNTPSTDKTTTDTDKTTTDTDKTTTDTDKTTTPTDKTTTPTDKTTTDTDKTTTDTDKTTTPTDKTTTDTDKTTTPTDKTTTPTDKTTTPTDKTTTDTTDTPTQPTQPAQPTTPSTVVPTTPSTPTTPTQPTTPTTPSKPSVDAPTVPDAPSTPNAKNPNASKPHTTAVQKTSPARATAPKSSASVNTSVPKTGDQTNLLLFVALFGGAAAALAAVLMLKKKEHE